MDEPKDNKCTLLFQCNCFIDSEKDINTFDDCVYIKQKTDGECKYINYLGYCSSSVAIVNRCVLTLKEHGVNINV